MAEGSTAVDESAANGPGAKDPGGLESPPPRRGFLGLFGRASWNLVDQALSSGTNFALVVVVARTVHDAKLNGAFAVALIIFSFLIAMERALVGQIMGMRYSATEPRPMRTVAARGLGTVAVLGIVAGLVLAVAGLLIGGATGTALIAVGVVMAPLLMQDTVRMIFFAQGRPKLAALNDAVWAVTQFSTIFLLVSTGTASVGALVLAWGGAAAVSVLLALVQLRVVPQLGATVSWCREHGDVVGYLLPETLLTSGGLQGSLLVVTRLVGVAAAGAFKAGQTLLGPLAIISNTVMTFAIPEISRRKHLPPRTKWWVALGLSAVMFLGSAAYLTLLIVMPEAVGVWLFSESWAGARSVLVPMGLFSAVAGASMGPALVVIAMGHAKKLFRVTVIEAPLVIVLMIVGALIAGAPGAAWGQFLAGALQLPLWFWTLRQTLREPVLDEEPEDRGRPDNSTAGSSAEDSFVGASSTDGADPVAVAGNSRGPAARHRT